MMNRPNETMLTSPNLNYTSRDFTSIYNELLASIPTLTKEWEAKDENDPGIVLLKMMAMIGDMLSYNQDKQALEAFPKTVLQRANAQQIFRLIGYKMHWWRSAIVEASFTNANTFPIMIGRYNTFTTADSNIIYTNLSNLNIPAGAYGTDAYTTELIQGTPVTPIMNGSVKPDDYNAEWHSAYDYNVSSSDFVNNKLFIKYTNIDENSLTLIDNDETPFAQNEWTLVKNINLTETMDKVFEFDIDEDGTPFIQLPDYWKTKFVITKFKLFFVLSDGPEGEIEENTLTTINSKKCYVNQDNISISSALSQVSIFNTTSTYGYAPETCAEARKEAEKYQNTIDTLVILKDFENATRRIDSVANVVATDAQTDPNKSEMSTNQINLYIVRKNDYNNSGENYIYSLNEADDNTDEIFKENVVGELSSYKLMPYDININLENKIDWIDWSVRGQIFLRKPINSDENYDLMVKINNNLKNRFNTETLDFNEAVNYMDVIECIMKTDRNIWHVDLDTSAIEYTRVKRNLKGNETGLSINNKYMIYDSNGNYTGYYMTSFGCTDTYTDKIMPYIVETDPITGETTIKDDYANIYDNSDIEPGFIATTNSDDVSKTSNIITENSITYGGSGDGKNVGNRIVREDGLETVVGIDFGRPDEPREYEVYNKCIIDWTGYEPINTGRVIDTSTTPFKIKKYDEFGNLVDTGYTISYDSRMYMEDGSDAHRYLKDSYRQIQQLCDISVIYDEDKLKTLSIEEKDALVAEGCLRKTYDIINSQYETWTGESIDKITGEIFMLRGDYWYSTNKSYNEDSGAILDTYGEVQYDDNGTIIREAACREDITGEYIQDFNVEEYFANHDQTIQDNNIFEFYLGQDAKGNPLYNSIGNMIEAYPIKPYSVFIYINGDEDIIADNGTGKLSSTPGLLNGWGTIDYDTGLITFKTNIVPESMRILYKVNKFTYSHYINFDTSELYVRPEYIRSENRK